MEVPKISKVVGTHTFRKVCLMFKIPNFNTHQTMVFPQMLNTFLQGNEKFKLETCGIVGAFFFLQIDNIIHEEVLTKFCL